MDRALTDLHVGTSGWSYDHWTGPFYPRDLPSAERLAFYARRFSTVEVNASFYRLPEARVVTRWRDAVPPDFVFSVKASRYITHMKKLLDARETLPPFYARVALLGRRLGPLLFQLPPRWRVSTRRLEAFLTHLDARHRHAFEFRDPSGFDPAIRRVLERYGVAFCIYELGGRLAPQWITADFVYVRLHGPGAPYQGRYDDATLAGWARAFSKWMRQGKAVYCYFDNDQLGYAALDALRLRAMLEHA